MNPSRLEGQNFGRYSVSGDPRERTASDIKELVRRLSHFTNDELRQIPIVPNGTDLKQGAVYLDLRHPESGPTTAGHGTIAAEHNCYTPKTEVPYEIWKRLLDTLCPAARNEDSGDYVVTTDDSSRQPSEALIDEALKESFPASDPPAWTTGQERRKK